MTACRPPRTIILDTYKEIMTGEWEKLLLNYPPGSKQPTTTLRVVAPNKAVGNLWSKLNPPPTQEKNDSNFNSRYLDPYLNSVWNNNQIKLQVDCSELKPEQGQGIYNGVVENGAFNFVKTDDGKHNFSIKQPESNQAFGGAGVNFDAPANTPKVICIRELTVAINTGLLPITNNALLNKGYFISRKGDFL